MIVEGCRDLPVDVAAEAQARVLPRAGGQNPGRLKKSLRAAILAADPSLAQRRETTAKTERRVVISPVADGMAELWALLPAVDATAIDTALNAAARAMKTGRPGSGAGLGDVRTMDQRRADALAAPFHAALASGTLDGVAPRLAKRRGARAQLLVTVPASTLLGVTAAPGELAGYGPISADVARHIATDATWRRVLTDPVGGAVLDVGVTTYRPPAGLDRLVKTRDNTCCFPGCNWPAVDCELDHTKPFPQGPTAAHNLGPCCKRHHLFKHTAPAGARLRQISPGVFRWTMPTGHTHTVNAPAVALPLKEELRIKSPEAEGPPTARDP